MASIDLSEQRLKELIDPVSHIVRCKRKTIALRISDDLQLVDSRALWYAKKKRLKRSLKRIETGFILPPKGFSLPEPDKYLFRRRP